MKRSLTHLPPEKADQLRRITKAILALAEDKVAMIILFGSYARGDWVEDQYTRGHITYTYQSDYDLLLVMAKPADARHPAATKLDSAIGRRLRKLGLSKASISELGYPTVNTIIHDIADVNKMIERGNYFFNDIKQEGIVLYDSKKRTLARRRKLDTEERKARAVEDFEHWFTSASTFIITYEAALQLPDYKNAAFQLHQATERFYGALEMVFTGYKHKTHDIEKLSQRAGNHHPDFFRIFPRATEEEDRLFKLLKAAYVDARYKPEYTITREELDYLAGRVRDLQKLTKKVCQNKIETFI